MIKNPRNLLWVIPLVFFVTSPIWQPPLSSFLQPRGDFTNTIPGVSETNSRNFVMDSITITLSSMGNVEWIVNADRAFTGKTDREIGLIEVDAVYTDPLKKNTETKITSSRGTYDVDDRHLTLIDNVVVLKPAVQQEMYSDLLHYYDDSKMVVSPGDVEIKAPTFNIEAGQMDYDLTSDAYDLSKGVVCDF